VIDRLDLPKIDIPDRKPKRLPPAILFEWMAANIRRLKESGQMKRIRGQASRQPSPERFVL